LAQSAPNGERDQLGVVVGRDQDGRVYHRTTVRFRGRCRS
jgi:hypothetical protein